VLATVAPIPDEVASSSTTQVIISTTSTTTARTSSFSTTSISQSSSLVLDTTSSRPTQGGSPSASNGATTDLSRPASDSTNTASQVVKSKGMSTGAKAGIGVAIPLILLAVIAILMLLKRRRKTNTLGRKDNHTTTSHKPELHGESVEPKYPGVITTQAKPETDDGFAAHELKSDHIEPRLASTNSGLVSPNQVHYSDSSPLGEHIRLHGSPAFELPDSQVSPGTSPTQQQNYELSASPTSNNSQLYSTSMVASPTTPPTVAPSAISTSRSTGDSLAEQEHRERERRKLEKRRSQIAAQKEHIRRLQQLEEEESHIEDRLRSL
jgi:hypothetical protein